MLNRLYLFVMNSGSEFLGRAKKVFNVKLIYTKKLRILILTSLKVSFLFVDR